MCLKINLGWVGVRKPLLVPDVRKQPEAKVRKPSGLCFKRYFMQNHGIHQFAREPRNVYLLMEEEEKEGICFLEDLEQVLQRCSVLGINL